MKNGEKHILLHQQEVSYILGLLKKKSFYFNLLFILCKIKIIIIHFFKIFSVTENWKGLVHSLSGLICASLNFLDLTTHSYASGTVSDSVSFNNYFRYGTLSREIVCTENLTPFKSLLPTRGKVFIDFFKLLLLVMK